MEGTSLLIRRLAREPPTQAEDQRKEGDKPRGLLDRTGLRLVGDRAPRAGYPTICFCSNRSGRRLDRVLHASLRGDRLSVRYMSAEDYGHAGQDPEDRRTWELSDNSRLRAPKRRSDHKEGCSQRTFHGKGGD